MIAWIRHISGRCVIADCRRTADAGMRRPGRCSEITEILKVVLKCPEMYSMSLIFCMCPEIFEHTYKWCFSAPVSL